MPLPRRGLRTLPSLCLCVLVLAWVVACEPDGTPTPLPAPEESRWSLVPSSVQELVGPLLTRTRERWQRFWGPGAFQGFVQTYYEDHLRDLGPRAQAWLASSRDRLLNTAQGLCPRLLCRDKDQD